MATPVGPYEGNIPAAHPDTGQRPPVPLPPPALGKETDDQYNLATSRLPLPLETQTAYNARVTSVRVRH